MRILGGVVTLALGLALPAPVQAVTLSFDIDEELVVSRSRVESEFAVFRPDVGDWGVAVWNTGVWEVRGLVVSGLDNALVADFVEPMESVLMYVGGDAAYPDLVHRLEVFSDGVLISAETFPDDLDYQSGNLPIGFSGQPFDWVRYTALRSGL